MRASHDSQEVRLDGRKLRALRSAREWTQVELAERAKLGQSLISMLECGTRHNTELGTINSLARALQVRPVDLLLGVRNADDLPDFATFVQCKFSDDPKLQKALLAAYELFKDKPLANNDKQIEAGSTAHYTSL